jgi:hypothetical protein
VTGVPSFFNILYCDILLLSLVANLPPVPTTLVVNENLRKDVNIGVKDTNGIIDYGGKYATGVIDTEGVP